MLNLKHFSCILSISAGNSTSESCDLRCFPCCFGVPRGDHSSSVLPGFLCNVKFSAFVQWRSLNLLGHNKVFLDQFDAYSHRSIAALFTKLSLRTRVVKFEDDQISSQFSGSWRGNISDFGQPTRALIMALNRRSDLVTSKFRELSLHIRVVPKSGD
jgi:hypothetical protein